MKNRGERKCLIFTALEWLKNEGKNMSRIQSKILPIDKLLKIKNCLFAYDRSRKTSPLYF